jgi:hypothetical protein
MMLDIVPLLLLSYADRFLRPLDVMVYLHLENTQRNGLDAFGPPDFTV